MTIWSANKQDNIKVLRAFWNRFLELVRRMEAVVAPLVLVACVWTTMQQSRWM